jgi:hypothetical protein
MKKLLLLIAYSLAITSCVAQESVTEPAVSLIGNFTVITICEGDATIQNAQKDRLWIVAGNGLEEGSEYLMKLIQTDCRSCFKRNADVIGFEFSTRQVEKNQREMIRQTAIN